MLIGVIASAIAKISGGTVTPSLYASFANEAGGGDRRSIITVTMNKPIAGSGQNFVDGVQILNDVSNSWFWSAASGAEILFDFASPQYIDKFILSKQAKDDHGTWKVQASTDNSTWVDVSSAFSMNPALIELTFDVVSNLGVYQYYKIKQVTGSVNNGPYYYEILFNCYSESDPVWPETPAYSNPMGTGKRYMFFPIVYSGVANGDVKMLTDGNGVNSFWWITTISEVTLEFQFPRPAQITEATLTFSGAANHGSWQWEIYDELTSSWLASGSSFAINGASTVIDAMSSETRSAKRHRMRKISGSTNQSPYFQDISFKIGWPAIT